MMQFHKINKFQRLLAMMLSLLMVFSLCGTELISLVFAAGNTQQEVQVETREEVKARLMRQIRYEGWDPYAEDMTIDEFYALMELFEEGKLPLKSTSTVASPRLGAPGIDALGIDEPGIDEPSTPEAEEELYIPRTKFLFAGLTDYKRNDGSKDNASPEDYDTKQNYEPIDGAAEDEPQYHYPSGLDPFGKGYKRPPLETWKGVPLKDSKSNSVVLVSEGANSNNMAVAGNVIQELFASYTGYYVKQITIAGANVNVLGMIELNGRYVYYYLSAEEQDTQVSTTMLPDDAKFIVEYVPIEHEVKYEVKLDDGTDVTNKIPKDVVIFGSNSPTKVSWADSIFGVSRPNRTTDGAYSFDVLVPYGYELRILISIDMSVDEQYASKPNAKPDFVVVIDHTSKKEDVRAAWLKAYSDYLQEEGFIDSADEVLNSKVIRKEDSKTGNITLEWKDENDPDKPAHDSILSRIAERINDFVLHNNGYPLGKYPDYSEKGEGGFKIIPNGNNGPTELTMNDTFYNHLVKADRTVTAVLTKQGTPTFDVSQILQKSDGVGGRGSSADKDFAFASLDKYDEDYQFHLGGGAYNATNDPLGGHSAAYPNVKSGDGWKWTNNNNGFRTSAQQMKQAADGTYYYTWLFQTNSEEGGYYLDAFEVNGIPISIPFYPKYNWKDTYIFEGSAEKADAKHPYYTETTLADGSILKLEFLLGFNSGPPQRHYRVTVTGARSNVVVTGLNLMTGTGADEFVTYNLVGVYSDRGGYSQTAPAIEYYDRKAGWTRKAQANVIVLDNSNNVYTGIDYNNGDADNHGANIRFKIAEGYGNPYYSWTNRQGDVIKGQASVTLDDEWNVTSTNEIKYLKDVVEGNKLDSRYIYYDGDDGYYYIRVTNQNNNTPGKDNYKFALLTVVARTIKYTVRYLSEFADNEESWSGFSMNSETGQPEKLLVGDESPDPKSMPSFKHNADTCALWELAKVDGEVPEETQNILNQFDDNDGNFYDLLHNTKATIATNTYGTVRPTDGNNKYNFANWILVGNNGMPVRDSDGKLIQFLGGAIDLTEYSTYAVRNNAFGDANTDIFVLRLMPVWSLVANPFSYNVALNWVDAQGVVHQEYFADYWQPVLTDWVVKEDTDYLTVQVVTDSTPFKDWIANHPTYTFWDAVNNNNALYRYRNDPDAGEEAMKKEMDAAIAKYLPELKEDSKKKQYEEVLAALCKRDISGWIYDEETGEKTDQKVEDNNGNLRNDFWRLGNYAYQVHEDEGTIVVWMYEDKGGLVFHEKVLPESFLPDEDFYFTVVEEKSGSTGLTGTYKAYPEQTYDKNGNPIKILDKDAWLVTFENGRIKNIVPNDGLDHSGDAPVTYFTLKSGEGIMLYVPAGRYTIIETGSQSGNTYKASVTYTSTDGSIPQDPSWIIPQDGQLVGNEKAYQQQLRLADVRDIRQVAATVDFKTGQRDVVQTLTFINSTFSMRLDCHVMAPTDDNLWKYNFGYQLAFTLPSGETPPQDDNGYYYNVIHYQKTVDTNGKTKYVGTPGKLRMETDTPTGIRALWNRIISLFGAEDNVWTGVIEEDNPAFTLKGDDYYVIVLPAPNDPSDTVGYTATETEPTDSESWHLDGGVYARNGILVLGEQMVETYVNTINNPSLYVTKTVDRSDGVKDTTAFKFTVTLSNLTYSDSNFTNGVATFYLKDGDSIFLPLDIPGNGTVTYTVSEEPNKYTTTSTNESGTFVDGSMIRVDFVNTLITDPGYLVITETGGQSNESFLYRITNKGTGESIIVSVKGGGMTYVCAPLGEYTIEEITNWAWRYKDGKCVTPATGTNSATVKVTSANDTPANAVHADFINERNDKMWLGGEDSKDNHFTGPSTTGGEQETNSRKTEYAMPAVTYNGEKKKQNEGDGQ